MTSPSFLPTCSTAHRGTFCPSSKAKRNPPFFASLQFYRRQLLCYCTYVQTLTLSTQHTCQRCCAIILPRHDANLSSDWESPNEAHERQVRSCLSTVAPLIVTPWTPLCVRRVDLHMLYATPAMKTVPDPRTSEGAFPD